MNKLWGSHDLASEIQHERSENQLRSAHAQPPTQTHTQAQQNPLLPTHSPVSSPFAQRCVWVGNLGTCCGSFGDNSEDFFGEFWAFRLFSQSFPTFFSHKNCARYACATDGIWPCFPIDFYLQFMQFATKSEMKWKQVYNISEHD